MSFFKKSIKKIYEPDKCASFEKVSYDQFKKDFIKLFGEETISEEKIETMYNSIELPKRSTKKSAGYDFVSPFGFNLHVNQNIVIPTGIRAKMDDDIYLSLYPRSGMGFKYRLMLANTAGIIDADYYESDNEGHIMAKICYEGIEPIVKIENTTDEKIHFECIDNKESFTYEPLVINQGDKFIQGIFNIYGITEDDNAFEKRIGGFGSTGK